MTQGNVTMTVRKVGDNASVVDIRGDVNADAENALSDAYTQASTGGVKTIILNFSELEYMNSTGIGLLVTLLIYFALRDAKPDIQPGAQAPVAQGTPGEPPHHPFDRSLGGSP